MSNDKPVIAPFERAIKRLEEGLVRYRSDTTDTLVRDGLIHRFKFTYGLGHKILKRHLQYASANPEQFNRMTFQDLIRTANEHALLRGEWIDWRDFREMRAKTNHAYQEEISLDIIENLPRFIEEVVYLRDRLRDALRN